nr:reverse transcriptase domain-containing protein [Tanacetum cinerariifolium]
MQTRSSSRLVSNPSSNLNPKGRNCRRSKQRIEEFNLDELSPPIFMMADQRTMAKLLQAPTEGYEDAIVVPAITADNFELKHGLLTLKLHHLDTFYNALNSKDQDSLNSVAGVEESCVTCGGAHSYRNCPVPDGNVYRENIQEFVSQASAVNYNQGNTSYRPPMMSNQIRPPGFPPIPNNQNVQLNQRNNQNHFNQNQNRGNNFNHGPVYQPLVFQPPAYQAPTYQAPAPQTQGVSKEDFLAYVKANDAVMRNMQTQGQNMQNQLTNLTDLLTKFVNFNNASTSSLGASTSSSGTLPSNTIANLRSDLKAITTRSGVSYDGPQIPPPTSFLPKVVENEPEATKDTVHPTNNGITEDVQPQVVQLKSLILTSKPVNSPISEPVASPVSALRPNLRPSILYPSRMQDQKLRDKTNDQREKFFQIFKDLNFNISFADALILMPNSNEKDIDATTKIIKKKPLLEDMSRNLMQLH